MEVVPQPALPGDLRHAETIERSGSLQGGDRSLAFDRGADNVWHEQVTGFPASDDGSMWSVVAPDGVCYVQGMSPGTMATHIVVLAGGGERPLGLGAAAYLFSGPVDDEAMVTLLKRCRAEAQAALPPGVMVAKPSTVRM